MWSVRGLIVILAVLIVAAAKNGESITTESSNTSEKSWETLVSSNTIVGSTSSETISRPSPKFATDVYSSSEKYYNSTSVSPSASESVNTTEPGNISSTDTAAELTNNTGNSMITTSLLNSDNITEVSWDIEKSTISSILETTETTFNHTTVVKLLNSDLSVTQSNITASPLNSTTVSSVTATTETADNLSSTESSTWSSSLATLTSASLSSFSSSSSSLSTTLPKPILSNVTILNSLISNLTSGPSPFPVSTTETTADSNNTELPMNSISQPNNIPSNYSSLSANSSTIFPESSLANVTEFDTSILNFTVQSSPSHSSTTETLDFNNIHLPTNATLHPKSTASNLPSLSINSSTVTNTTDLNVSKNIPSSSTEKSPVTMIDKPSITVEAVENQTLIPSKPFSSTTIANVHFVLSNMTESTIPSMTTSDAMKNNATTGSTNVESTPLNIVSTSEAEELNTTSATALNSTSSESPSRSGNHSKTTDFFNVTVSPLSTVSSVNFRSTVNPLTTASNDTSLENSTMSTVSKNVSSHPYENSTNETDSSPTIVSTFSPSNSSDDYTSTTTSRPETTTHTSSTSSKIWNWVRSFIPKKNSTSITNSAVNDTIGVIMTSPPSSTTEFTINSTVKDSTTDSTPNLIGGTNTNTDSTSSSNDSTLKIELEINSNSALPTNTTTRLESNIDDYFNSTVNLPTTNISSTNNSTLSIISSSSTSSDEYDNKNATDSAEANVTTLSTNYPLLLTTKLNPSMKVSVTSGMTTNIDFEATNATYLGDSTGKTAQPTIAPAVGQNTTEEVASTTRPAIVVKSTEGILTPAPRTPKAFNTSSITTITTIPSNVLMKINSTTETPLTNQPANTTLPMTSMTTVPLNSTTDIIYSSVNDTNTTQSITVPTTNLEETSSTAVFTNMTTKNVTNATNVTQINVTNTTQSPYFVIATAVGGIENITESPMPETTLPSIYNSTHVAISSSSSTNSTNESEIPSTDIPTLSTSTSINNSSEITTSPESTSTIPNITASSNPTTASEEIMTNSLAMNGVEISTFKYVVKDKTTEIPCMLLNMTISMKISYNKTDKTIGEGTLVVPNNASSNGTCSEKSSQIMLAWNTMRNKNRDLKTYDYNTIFLNFVNDGSKSSLDRIDYQVYLDQKTFRNATTPTLSGSTTTGLGLFSSTVNHGHYICNTVTDVDIGNVIITISNVSLIAFNEDEDLYSKKEEQCVTTSGINMGAVIGGSVGGIIIIVLAVIYFCRRKSSSYDNSSLP